MTSPYPTIFSTIIKKLNLGAPNALTVSKKLYSLDYVEQYNFKEIILLLSFDDISPSLLVRLNLHLNNSHGYEITPLQNKRVEEIKKTQIKI